MTNLEKARALRSAASALEHGRLGTARKKLNLATALEDKEKDALDSVLRRALDDAGDYLLGPHAKLDYCDEYADTLRNAASEFRLVANICRNLGLVVLDGYFAELAGKLEEAAKEDGGQ